MEKKSVLFVISVFLLLSLVLAQNKLEISTIKSAEEKYSPGENITLRISLYSPDNSIIDDNILVILTDSAKTVKIEKILPTNKIVEVDLGEHAPSGAWTALAAYTDKTTGQQLNKTTFFFVDLNELARFELNGDSLTITNIGNTRYTKTISIILGESIGTKNIEGLEVGDSIKLKLIAPDGEYNVKITDGKTTISRDKVALTGDVIGVLDERLSNPAPGITGGIGQSSILKSSFIYIFLIAVFVAAILLAVENKYRKKLGKM